MAGSDNLTAQAVIYASAQEPLVGEEMFSAGAYVESSPLHSASVTVQDILRWLVIAAMVVGALLTLVGIL